MKNIAYAMLLAAGMGTSLTAGAAGTAITNAPITSTDCTLLGEPVTINRSKNVLAAYQCTESTTTIAVATCHESGSRKATDVACVGTDSDADGTNDTWTPAGCDATTPTVTISDYKGFGGTSKGGSLGTYELGGNCTQSAISGISLFQ